MVLRETRAMGLYNFMGRSAFSEYVGLVWIVDSESTPSFSFLGTFVCFQRYRNEAF